MATENTGYKFMHNGTLKDFYGFFRTGNAGITTRFTVANGTDLGTLFEGGDAYITTGYYNNLLNTDLGRLFARLTPFIAVNAPILGFTNSYYYAIFTDTSVTGIIRPTSNFNYPAGFKLNIICVGGGGGGGGAKGGESCGGGGGGGVYLHSINYNNDSVNYRVTVGEGGSGGPSGVSGSPGGKSEIAYRYLNNSNLTKFIIRCTGGGQGTTNSAGSGGQVYLNDNTNTPIAEGNGGNGGDQSAGANCYYNLNGNSLNISNELINLHSTDISYYYSGGGGGSKSNNRISYAPGKGGGTLGGDSPTWSNTGFGGARGNEGSPADGNPGNGYGSGGGAGGARYYPADPMRSDYFPGGAGKQGIVIVYAEL